MRNRLTLNRLFVHSEADQLRQIENSDVGYVYHVHGKTSSMDFHKMSERLNRRRGQAVHGGSACIKYTFRVPDG